VYKVALTGEGEMLFKTQFAEDLLLQEKDLG